jgi:hypothetical protein
VERAEARAMREALVSSLDRPTSGRLAGEPETSEISHGIPTRRYRMLFGFKNSFPSHLRFTPLSSFKP